MAAGSSDATQDCAHRAVLVGLTGGIGSGKSAVAQLLAGHGARVVDADALARDALAPGAPGLLAVIEEFGQAVLGADGELDRKRLAATVFADPPARETLNAIVHPLVAERLEAAIAEASPGEVVVYDVPLLVETSVRDRHDFDLILVVEAAERSRIARLARDRGMTERDVRARMSSQATDEQRRAVADVVIMNDGSRADLSRAVARVWRERIRPAL